MAIYFKFKSAKDYDSISIEGYFISVGKLKEKIIEKKNLGSGSDFDLVICNAQTNEVYTDEGTLLTKNMSVLVRRVPGQPRMPIIADVRNEKAIAEASNNQLCLNKNGPEVPDNSLMKQCGESDWADEFGMDLYTMPEDLYTMPEDHTIQLVINKTEEDNKIKAFLDTSAYDWERQTQNFISLGRGSGRGCQGRTSGGRGFARVYEKKTPPQNYVCHRCGIPGHFIQHCATNGDPAYDVKKVKPPTGIPKSMLVANPDGVYALPSGGVAVLRPNEAVFEKEIEGHPLSKSVGEIPLELCCPLCTGALKDAVLTSKCCFKSYCDKCIRDQIILKGKCVCGAANVLADDLLPNRTLREAIDRLLEATTVTSSAENAGSRHQVQDIESARCPRPKAASPSASTSLKETFGTMPQSDGSNAKGHIVNTKPYFQGTHKTAEKITCEKILDPLKHESRNARNRASDVLVTQSVLQVEDEVQQKMIQTEQVEKKKGKPKRQHHPQGGNEMHWRTRQGFSTDLGIIAYGGNSVSYKNHWNLPQWPLDAYVPYMCNAGYICGAYGGPRPFQMEYTGALMIHDASMPPTIMPPFQSGCMDYHVGNVSSILSHNEFEDKKDELKRKRGLEQRSNNRDQATDLGSDYAELQSSSRMKASERLSLACLSVKERPISSHMHGVSKRRSLGGVTISSHSQSVSRRIESKDDLQQSNTQLLTSDSKYKSLSNTFVDRQAKQSCNLYWKS